MAKTPSKATSRLTRTPYGSLDPSLQPIIENIEILNGARGQGLDRAVLMRDLADLGYITLKKGAGNKLVPTLPGGGVGPDDGTVEAPELPKNVKATGGFTNILVEWDSPKYKGHAYTEILRSATDDFSAAVKISTTAANLYGDSVGTGKTFYYWVRFVNKLDVKGPIQSTAGIKGITEADVGDILDQLKGQIDESFMTPQYNSQIKDISDLTKLNEQGLKDLEGSVISSSERVDLLEASADIIAEAAMEAATGVDQEGLQRRKVEAQIKLEQKVIVTDLGAQAQQILTIIAKVDDNEAKIQETRNAVITLDAETKQAIESITQRIDTQQSVIDGNSASITSMGTTLVQVGDKADATANDLTVLTDTVNSQKSEIDDNKASITSQGQTIVTINGKADSNAASIKSLSETVTTLQATVGNNTASIQTNSQTIVTVKNTADSAKADAATAQSTANSAKSEISVLSQQMTTVTSDLNGTKAQVAQNSQTIATINADGSTAYKAQWGVKASIGDIQAGIGLTAKKNPDGSSTTQCTVIAQQFSVGYIGPGGTPVYPFIIDPTYGVVIDTARIKAAKIQDLVAGDVIADNIKASATLTAPYIKGGRIEIGSRFTVDENGNMRASNAYMDNAIVYGTVYANGGEFSNVLIKEDCDVKGTIYANKIIGDVYKAYMADVSQQGQVGNTNKLVYQVTIPKQNFARQVEWGSVAMAIIGSGLVKFILNGVLVYSIDFSSEGGIVSTPIYIGSLPANTDGIMRLEFSGNAVWGMQKSKVAAWKV